MTHGATRLLGSMLLALALATACAGRSDRNGQGEGEGEGEGERDEREEPATDIVTSDPAVLATYEPWEASCIRWMRASCRKSAQCDLPLAPDCDDDDETVRATCNETDADDTPCANPDPVSFDNCLTRDREETCSEFCEDGRFCFNFCFFRCLD